MDVSVYKGMYAHSPLIAMHLLDWIWCFWNLRPLELCFVDSPRVFEFSGYLESKEAVREAVENHQI